MQILVNSNKNCFVSTIETRDLNFKDCFETMCFSKTDNKINYAQEKVLEQDLTYTLADARKKHNAICKKYKIESEKKNVS